MNAMLTEDSALVRGQYVVADPGSPNTIAADGAIYVEHDRVVAMGDYHALHAEHPTVRVIGSGAEVVLPGLINAHDHGRGISTAQAGIPDYAIELWLLSLGALPPVDPYLAAAYAAAQAIECGITTVVNSFYEAPLQAYQATLGAALSAHEHAGLRSVWALSILDRSAVKSIYEGCLPDLPASLAAQTLAALQNRPVVQPPDYFALCRDWQAELTARAQRASLLCGPISAHWCSDELLGRLRDFAAETGMGMQTHLLETPYQRQQAFGAFGESMVAHLAHLGFLSRKLSCAHGVWLTESDMDLLAEAGVSIVHCPGSNLRLASGVAPVAAMLAHGIHVGMGLDSNTLHDNGDMWQELRLAAHLHRQPGTANSPAPAAQWLAMATSGAAGALSLDQQVGKLSPGMKADLILVSMERIESPYAAPAADLLSLLLARADARDVASVMIDGQLVLHERKLLTLDKQAIAAELHAQVTAALRTHPAGQPALAQALLPYASRFCRLAPDRLGTPYYRFNSQEEA